MTDNSLLDKVLKDLFDQAFEDGVITDDEFDIIQQVEIGIDEYSKALGQAEADGIITIAEHEQLEEIKRRIMSQAQDIAKLDGIIDTEETTLLTKLSEIIEKYLTQSS